MSCASESLFVQVKSVCEERLSLVNTDNSESGRENSVTDQETASVSHTADAKSTAPDAQADLVTRKYYEVHF